MAASMIGLQSRMGEMNGASWIVSRIPCLTIVSESTVFQVSQKNPMISKAGRFGGTADGMLPSEVLLVTWFQGVMMSIDNRVGVKGSTVE
jgi:hypothetical protein